MATLSAGAAIAVEVWNGKVLTAAGDLFRVDALSALMVAIITFLGAVASLYAVGYIRAELDDAHLSRVRLFFMLFHRFIFTMLVAVTTDNLGVMWIAVEGRRWRRSLVNLRHHAHLARSRYKYLILSSVGIALAFIGTALVYYAVLPRRKSPSIGVRCAPPRGHSIPKWYDWRSCSSSLAMGPRRAWRRCIPGCPMRTAKRPHRSAR
jgi:hydrogenase-4 component F